MNDLDLDCWAIGWRVTRPDAPVASSTSPWAGSAGSSPCFLVEERRFPFSYLVLGGMLLMRRTFAREGLVGTEVPCD